MQMTRRRQHALKRVLSWWRCRLRGFHSPVSRLRPRARPRSYVVWYHNRKASVAGFDQFPNYEVVIQAVEEGNPTGWSELAVFSAHGYEKSSSQTKCYGDFHNYTQLVSEARTRRDRGDVLTVGGADGAVRLFRCQSDVSFRLGDAASFGDDCRPYVGDLPGLAALGGLGAAAGPAVVLGTDVLRRRPRLIYTRERIYV